MALHPALKLLSRALPTHWQTRLRPAYRASRDACKLLWAGLHDSIHFARHSSVLRMASQRGVRAHMVKSYHRLEKGLALRAPRPGFGVDAVELLFDDLARYIQRFGTDDATDAALQVLEAYRAFNEPLGSLPAGFGTALARIQLLASDQDVVPGQGGVRATSRDEIASSAAVDFSRFVRHRFSVRQFGDDPIDPEVIASCVADATFAPSVCNRCAGRVHAVRDRGRIRSLLALQNGNRGFGEEAAIILVVTVTQAAFHSVGERYQGWIDGGLFAMTLVYALHARGLGTCCLNWSVEPSSDRAIAAELGLPADERVLMLLAVGHMPSSLVVARSARPDVDQILTWV